MQKAITKPDATFTADVALQFVSSQWNNAPLSKWKKLPLKCVQNAHKNITNYLSEGGSVYSTEQAVVLDQQGKVLIKLLFRM